MSEHENSAEHRVEQVMGHVSRRAELLAEHGGRTGQAIASPVALLHGGLDVATGLRDAQSGADTAARVNGGFRAAGGALHAIEGVRHGMHALAGEHHEGGGGVDPLAVAGHVLQSAQGATQVAISHGRSDTRRADGSYTDNAQTEVEGVRNVLHGALGLGHDGAGSSPAGQVMQALDRGLSVGEHIVDHTDAQAEASGRYGLDPYARSQRGAQATEAPRATSDNLSGSERAAMQGSDTFRETAASSYHWLHDHGLSDQTALSLSETYGQVRGGISAIGHGIANTGAGIYHSAADGARRLWHSIF